MADSLISIRTALTTILDAVAALPSLETPVEEAGGLVLAEEVTAREDVPLAPASAMDGFAVRSVELERASPQSPVTLRLLPETIFAGPAKPIALGHGCAVRLMTGAVLPAGGDAVVPRELTSGNDAEAVFTAPAPAGQFVRGPGSDVRAGGVVLRTGMELNAAALGLAVLAGRTRLNVIRRPRVAVMTSGDELIGPAEEMRPGLVRDVNRPMLRELIREAGCEPIDLGASPDAPEALRERLELAKRADALITAGGVSVGDRDLVRGALEERGLKTKFWGVAVKPGKPLLFGLLETVPAFGLPGNPVSAFVAFEVFVRPALKKLSGHGRLFRPPFAARLGHELRRTPGRPEFMRVRLEAGMDGLTARLTRPEQGSGIMTSLAAADGLLLMPAETEFLPAGSPVQGLLLGEPLAAACPPLGVTGGAPFRA